MFLKDKNLDKILSFVLVVLGLSYLGIVNYPLLLSPEGVAIKINQGDSISSITQNLKNKGLINSSVIFKLWLTMNGWLDDLKAGNYSFQGKISMAEVASKIAQGQTTPAFKITIPEGFSLKDVSQLLQQEKLLGPEDKFDISLLSGIEKNSYPYLANWKTTNPEGLIYPDTYFFEENSSNHDILEIILSNFNVKVYSVIKGSLPKAPLSFRDIIIIASLLEKEVISVADRKLVAGILLKRLEINMPLQVDATICYIEKERGENVCHLRESDFQIDSPYNTYKYPGLPQGPICNPSLDAIQAVLNPTESPYLYYLSAKTDSRTIFSKTYDEHLINKAQYID
jgi:UPF0755 protein